LVCYDSSGGRELYPTFTQAILKGFLVGSPHNNQLIILVEWAMIAVVLVRARARAVTRAVMLATAVTSIVVVAVTTTVTAMAVMVTATAQWQQ
jgi:hypothetical protein